MHNPTRAAWRKSRHSVNAQNCIEVADLDGAGRAVRDSKNPNGPTLTFTATGWAAFTAGMRSGDFN